MSAATRRHQWPWRGACLLLTGTLLLTACSDQDPLKSGAPVPADPNRPPNIIVFFTDDQGYADVGIHDARDDVLTPHIDQLARDGVLATQGYVTAPQCVPSRAGLLTGIHQNRFGLEKNEDGPLRPAQVTIAEHLKARGYVSGMAGKWHLGVDNANRHNVPPGANHQDYFARGQGFDEYFEGYSGHFTASHTAAGAALPHPPQRIEDDGFRVDLATRWSSAFIRRHAHRSFFLYIPYFAPHVPLEAPQEDLALFDEVAEEERRLALAMIHAIDRGVGQIRATLEAEGLSERSLIFFIGDNGAPVMPPQWNGSLNAPLVGEKGMLTDGGLRVPYIISWPGTLPAGRVYEHPLSSLDVARTALSQAGIDDVGPLDGVDLIPLLRAEEPPPAHQALYWRWISQAAIRTPRWKLILLGGERKLLFDYASADDETVDVSAEHPDTVRALERQLRAWSDSLPKPGLPQGEMTTHEKALYRHSGLGD